MNNDKPNPDDLTIVVGTSHGGPFDDEAYRAGYELRQVEELLETPDLIAGQWWNVRSANQAQIDLVAMRHGFVAAFTDEGNGRLHVVFGKPHDDNPTDEDLHRELNDG